MEPAHVNADLVADVKRLWSVVRSGAWQSLRTAFVRSSLTTHRTALLAAVFAVATAISVVLHIVAPAPPAPSPGLLGFVVFVGLFVPITSGFKIVEALVGLPAWARRFNFLGIVTTVAGLAHFLLPSFDGPSLFVVLAMFIIYPALGYADQLLIDWHEQRAKPDATH